MNPNLLKKSPFVQSKPVFEESTLRQLRYFVNGACQAYLVEGHQVSLTRGFGEVLNTINEYANATYDKVVSYLRGEAKLDASFSDHQVTVAEAAKLHFQPIGEPLSPGNRAQTVAISDGEVHRRIRTAFASLVDALPGNDPSLDTYAQSHVEFDMGAIQGPHLHKYPGFRATILQPKRFSYTHHFLIEEFVDRESLQAYADLMTGGDTAMIHVFDAQDVATHDAIVQMFLPTVMAQWRGLTTVQHKTK